MKKQFLQFFSKADWDANIKLEEELEALRQDLGKTWLEVIFPFKYSNSYFD
jgi:hypothetical protein